jgi:predicted DNA-binding protein (MmcQ/YjbR family)
MGKRKNQTRAELALRDHALTYPETTEDFPWEHRAIKVKGKVFLFLSKNEPSLSMTVKLPVSGETALGLPFATPTGYGLGKSGWVTARFEATDDVPLDMLFEWIDESFRAVAPKKVVAQLEAAEAAPDGAPKRKKKRKATR